jgi:16S rRNA processing protein RimM
MREEWRSDPSPGRRTRPSHLVIGRILAAHGLEGEVEAEILTDFPDRFSLLQTVYLGDEFVPVVVEGHRFHKNRVILKLAGCRGRNEALTLRGKLIHVPIEEAMPLEDDEYYLYQILGSEVWTAEEEFLGCVADILFTGANEVYVVRDGEREVLIPAISDVVTEVNMNEGRLTVQLMEGLR